MLPSNGQLGLTSVLTHHAQQTLILAAGSLVLFPPSWLFSAKGEEVLSSLLNFGEEMSQQQLIFAV